MGLQILTVNSIDTDTSKGGTMMLNTNRMGPFKATGTDSIFDYFEAQHSRKTHMNRYICEDTVATIAAAVAVFNKYVYALSVYIDNDTSNDTETKYFASEEIAKGIAYGSDDTKTWLWVEVTPGRVSKFLVNKPLATIKDYIQTGTTTTSTTSTTSTSTTSTTSTHT